MLGAALVAGMMRPPPPQFLPASLAVRPLAVRPLAVRPLAGFGDPLVPRFCALAVAGFLAAPLAARPLAGFGDPFFFWLLPTYGYFLASLRSFFYFLLVFTVNLAYDMQCQYFLTKN